MLVGAQLCSRDETAKILIPLAILDQQRVIAAIGAAHLRARVTLQSVLFHGRKEARRAVDAVAVE